MAKRVALILSGILGVYLVFAAWRGFDLLLVDDPAVRTLGVSVLVLPLLGVILVVREIKFGKLSYEMGQEISESLLPKKDFTEEEKRDFLDQAIERAKNGMDNWANWYSVALAYDVLNERKLAREAMQHSVELYQAAKPK
jgi:polyhydroxyalkanoate synthesis regulator phasin